MNRLVEENVQNIKCSQKSASTKNKSKKAKDPPETTNEINKLNEDKISEALVNTLHIKLNSNLTNGTSDHSNDSVNDSNAEPISLVAAPSEVAMVVNSVQCSDVAPTRESNSISSERNKVKYSEGIETETCEISSLAHALKGDIEIMSYESELQMPEIMRLIQKDLSEPYSIYTYRYFIHNWPKLCFLASHEGKCIGAIVCKLDMHRNVVKRGYIAMLAVDEKYRKRKIGSNLVQKAIQAMIDDNADEVVLETEITNKPALKLYENLGFVRDKRLFRYYLNGVDALRLKLWLR
ncbi:N-alpha-acetyltransferase 30-like [Pararge aegeria]|uniref:N-terminal methionine N(alpha)-acetyltransferase NatC n=2 Tax=Pararge aegeria TaxID=116150 RepID=A0A8S4RXV5_9NEOP|nr:N-alpha-acetyltransferase 30-like [Pararge aegeria]CAH2242674.1 jg8492 [Pararge aegeria aegeria]